jgi:hypothetical protein
MTRTRIVLASLPLVALLGIAWTASASGSPTATRAIYHNDHWHFAIAVPSDMKVDESEYRQAEQVIQFSDDNGHWLNVVAAPYTQLDVAIGEEGAPNTNTDQSATLGVVNVYRDNVYSVSFHRNRIAYSVVTNPDDEAVTRLLPILRSWEFTD